MPRSRSRRRYSSAPRRKTAWMGGQTDPAVVAAQAQSFVNMTETLEDLTENPIGRQGLTLIRIVGSLRINSTHATNSVEASFGFIMVDGDAESTGSVPDPKTDFSAPWLHWDRRVFLPPSDSGQHIALDIRVARKFTGNNNDLVLVLDNDDATESFEFALGFRCLFKLP